MSMMKDVMVKLEDADKPKTVKIEPRGNVNVEKLTLRKLVEEAEQVQSEEGEVSFEEGVKGGMFMEGHVIKRFVDKGFGFVNVKGRTVFCHADRVKGRDWLRVREAVWVKVMEDKAKGDGLWKAIDAWDDVRWGEHQAQKKANEAAAVAARASQPACQAVEKGKMMMEAAEEARMKVGIHYPKINYKLKHEDDQEQQLLEQLQRQQRQAEQPQQQQQQQQFQVQQQQQQVEQPQQQQQQQQAKRPQQPQQQQQQAGRQQQQQQPGCFSISPRFSSSLCLAFEGANNRDSSTTSG